MISPKKIIAFSAPSGAGKTSIVRHLTHENSELPLAFSVSATTRPKRQNETHGINYYFLSSDAFKQDIHNNAFLEYEEVYGGNFYGTYRSELTRIWELGRVPLFEIDVKGAINIKQQYPQETLLIFIKPPSIEVLKERLIGRDTETEAAIQERIDKAEIELSYESHFDEVVINENLNQACLKTKQLIQDFIARYTQTTQEIGKT